MLKLLLLDQINKSQIRCLEFPLDRRHDKVIRIFKDCLIAFKDLDTCQE